MTTKRELLRDTIEHIDIKSFDSTPIIESMKKMSFSSRDTANAADILLKMIRDRECTNMLTIAGSTSAGGCMQVYVDMIKHHMIDVIVATGASIIDMDFFEAIGYKHYIGRTDVPDKKLRDFYIDRIYDTFIDEDDLQMCDSTIKLVADKLERRPYSSREFIHELGRYLVDHSVKKDSLVQVAFENNVPIFCPAFSDCSAGFGLVKHQWENPDKHVTIDSVRDFRELTMIKMEAETSGLFMIGGGSRKISHRIRWFVQRSLESRFPCINMQFRSRLPMYVTEVVLHRPCRKLHPGERLIPNMNRWYMRKPLPLFR